MPINYAFDRNQTFWFETVYWALLNEQSLRNPLGTFQLEPTDCFALFPRLFWRESSRWISLDRPQYELHTMKMLDRTLCERFLFGRLAWKLSTECIRISSLDAIDTLSGPKRNQRCEKAPRADWVCKPILECNEDRSCQRCTCRRTLARILSATRPPFITLRMHPNF